MAAVLSPNRFTPYRSPAQGGGILLNPSPSHNSISLPSSYRHISSNTHPSPNSLSSSASVSSSDEATPSSSTTTTPPPSLHNSLTLPPSLSQLPDIDARHRSNSNSCTNNRRSIRFAPLPDPRRAVLVTDEGEELPLTSVFDDANVTEDAVPASHPTLSNNSKSLLLGDTVDLDPRAVPTITTTSPSPPSFPPTSSSSPPSPASTKRALSPSSHRIRSATAPNPSTTSSNSQSTPTLAKKLLKPFMFKPAFSSSSTDVSAPGSAASSRESSRTRDDTPAASPSAWGIPLGRWTSESATSAGAPSSTAGRRPSSSGGKSSSAGWGWGAPLGRVQSASASTIAPQPKRMLNGRVYGAPRKRIVPTGFESVCDEEPEFVEWGYGGMGSVKHGNSAWAKLQSDRKVAIGDEEERGRSVGRSSAEENDGSGMEWVRKRREAKERRERERQAAENAGVEDVGTLTQVAPQEVAQDGNPPHGALAHTRVAVPAPQHHGHAYAPSLSRQSTERQSVGEPQKIVQHDVKAVVELPKEASSDGDEDEDEDEVDEEREDGDEGDDEDDEEEQQRKTALGAGVELVSRHRE